MADSSLTQGDYAGIRSYAGAARTILFDDDRLTGATTRVSVDANGVQGNGSSQNVRISGDGRVVSIAPAAGNLVAGDFNGAADVFIAPAP